MATHWSSNAESLGDWTWKGASDGSYQLVQTTDYPIFTVNQGTWAIELQANASSGSYAQARKDIGTSFTTGQHMHFKTWLLACRHDSDWGSPIAPVISAAYKFIEVSNTDGTQAWSLRFNGTNGSTKGKKMYFYINSAATSSPISADGLLASAFEQLDIYTYIHNTAGYIQLWVNGSKVIEKANIDTYIGKVVNRINMGCVWHSSASDRLCTYFDGDSSGPMIWDNEASPDPPGDVARPKVFAGLGGHLTRGGLISGVQALREYRRIAA